MKKYFFLLIILLFARSAAAQWSPSPKHEVRAVWLTTIGGIDWPHSYQAASQQAELTRILDRLKQGGVNTVLVQTRVRGTTIYPSAFEPWDGCITGVPGKAPGYDPLQFCIEECHRRGMECHAWVVTIPVGKWNKLGCKELNKKFPKLIKRIGDEGYMDPESSRTGDYLADICHEITQRYDIDGIHLDYIRYPETWSKIAKRSGNTPAAGRRANITAIVRKIYHRVKADKPWVKVSCSPIGKYDDLRRYRSGGWNARTAVSQDAQAWLREGIMDALFPMMYFQGNNFYPFAIDWQEQSCGRIVVPGLGIYFLDPHEGRWTLGEVQRQMDVSRQLGMGHCYFRSKFFTDNTKGIYDFARRFDATPALVPPMTWERQPAPSAPATLKLDGGTLSWSKADDRSNAPYVLYNVYASRTYPVDVTQAANLVATRLTATAIRVPAAQRYYAVTAMNRYGQESRPVQLKGGKSLSPAAAAAPSQPIITTDGRAVSVPDVHATDDVRYLIVETLQGQQIAVRPYARKLDVSALSDGVYYLRTINRKGRSHRIATVAVKRP